MFLFFSPFEPQNMALKRSYFVHIFPEVSASNYFRQVHPLFFVKWAANRPNMLANKMTRYNGKNAFFVIFGTFYYLCQSFLQIG